MCGACLESFVVKRDGDDGFDFELLSLFVILFMIHNVPKQLIIKGSRQQKRSFYGQAEGKG